MKSLLYLLTQKYSGTLMVMILIPITSILAQIDSSHIDRRNVVKIDLTTNIFYSNALAFTYERLMKKNQTLSLTVGKEEIPTLGSFSGNEDLTAGRKTASGYKLASEYRFYLGKENKYNGPHGVYIGPYAAYHDLKNTWTIQYKNPSTGVIQEGSVDGKFQVTNIGFQAGYQFLISNRWSIDMNFIGASISNYRARMNVNGNFDIDESQINQEILDALIEKFPMLGDLLDDQEVDKSGKIDNWRMGLRYRIQVGYAFGGGKKKK